MGKKQVSLILTKDVSGLGKTGEQVSVKLGYAGNFLLPKKMAVLATKRAIERGEKVIEERRKKEAKMLEEIKKQVQNIKGLSIEIEEKVKKDGTLYGSVNENEIVKVVKEEGYDLKKTWVKLSEPIKKTGHYKILVKPHKDVEVNIKLHVKSKSK